MDGVKARQLALDLPEAVEKSHFGKADFRVRNRIFMSLPEADRAVVNLDRDQQEMMTAAEPLVFKPVPGGWGRKGWTSITLDACDEQTFRSALRAAWRNVAPPTLRKVFDATPS
ncbi:MmcQ/YjbR family DNA-binding protein [Mesorhizobium sp. M00.F.Ca.ET.186.01.1.1]|nr:MmcQ/YjbR family DNA-binding protein [bacterium M00.F.Ca.ET.205.01.1.1]TGU55910.1 MmcQ/YjbR family DNA-binding protein [bacterium M00.F.Ca.ET.152.01.1.1]TGV39821.1 MmcQ/YjbR family DNA-binding protein [Mesorhizobium sp. M00.F.Ca.ET.186.01.1.1]TGZ44801.1 MmcQ/YjbR family DNA-binding protein [bacterium M00.F.Ca.ET.162.01.1.1]TIW60688.1 MAG: MmcQ/YjbR family DNA-binding protein [Mesorhizobium sp.]